MRRFLAAAAAVAIAVGLSACGSSSSSGAPSGSGSTSAALVSCTKSGMQHLLFKPGVLTVATDNPVFTPWFVNNTPVKCIS